MTNDTAEAIARRYAEAVIREVCKPKNMAELEKIRIDMVMTGSCVWHINSDGDITHIPIEDMKPKGHTK